MTAYNAATHLRECIDSILAQTFTDFELLIVDDGSIDATTDIIRSYSDPRVRLICRPHDFTASLNTLLDEARGRYIARMDSDDVMMPERLRIQYDYLESHPEVAAVSAGAVKINEKGDCIGRVTTGTVDTVAVTTRGMCEFNMVCNPTSMFRQSVINQIGLRYDITFPVASDYRFWCDLLLRGGALHILPFDAIRYRISPTQISTARIDESNEAARRIQCQLKSTLVEKANPGYVDPEIAETGHDLTLIIPFLNEGDEVENTVRSFREFGGDRMDIIVINDCSYDSYPYMERLTAIPGVSYILNRERLGVAASRDKGVSLCHTPYFLLLDAHMRAYDDSWLTEIPRLLSENDRRILCCQTRILMRNESDEIMAQDYKRYFGARLTFPTNMPMPGIEWINEERKPDFDHEIIPAILGAGYGVSKRYWNHISGLRGLRQYGYDEQMLSLKAWLEGGECNLLKKVKLGHIFRSNMPYSHSSTVSLQNSLVISESLFPLELKCKARASAYIANRQSFFPAFSMCRHILEYDKEVSNWCGSSLKRTFQEFLLINNSVSPLEDKLRGTVENRLWDIAEIVLNSQAPNSGIFEGKAAYAIWLFHFAKYANDINLYRSAQALLDAAINDCDFTDLSFRTGLTGIGWAIWYLSAAGMIEALPTSINIIDNFISQAIETQSFLHSDLSFCDGLGGAIAYYCIRPSKEVHSSLQTKLNEIASKILTSKKNITFTEAFYSFLWLELNNNTSSSKINLTLTDWIISHRLLVKDSRFWKLSLFDGVLATSISFL